MVLKRLISYNNFYISFIGGGQMRRNWTTEEVSFLEENVGILKFQV
jgi:hypothetical protein